MFFVENTSDYMHRNYSKDDRFLQYFPKRHCKFRLWWFKLLEREMQSPEEDLNMLCNNWLHMGEGLNQLRRFQNQDYSRTT